MLEHLLGYCLIANPTIHGVNVKASAINLNKAFKLKKNIKKIKKTNKHKMNEIKSIPNKNITHIHVI